MINLFYQTDLWKDLATSPIAQYLILRAVSATEAPTHTELEPLTSDQEVWCAKH